jgi:hypothetical protein
MADVVELDDEDDGVQQKPRELVPQDYSPPSWSRKPKASHKIELEEFCICCLEHPRNTVFLDCKHLVTCSLCASKVLQCPVCRKDIDQEPVTVYK